MQEETKVSDNEMFDWNKFTQSDFILRKDTPLQSNRHTIYSKDQGKSIKNLHNRMAVSRVKLSSDYE